MRWNRTEERSNLQVPGGGAKGPVPLACRQRPELLSGTAAVALGEPVRLELAAEAEIGCVILRECGSHCTSFTLCAENAAGERIVLYENDVIDRYLYCAFEPVKVRALILTVHASDNGKPVRLCGIEAWRAGVTPPDFRVTVYYPLESGSRYFSERETDPDFQRDLDLLTDVILIGDVRFTREGALSYDAQTLRRELGALRRAVGARPVRIWCCILNPQRNQKLSNRDSAHAIHRHLDRMIENILQFCAEYQLDGIDFDWEFPLFPHYWHAHGELLIRLGESLHRQGLLLSAAFGPWGVQLNARARQSLDFVNVMAYDWPKNRRKDHAEFYTCHYVSARYFLKKGFQKRQLVLGVPFYGNTCDRGKLIQKDYSSFEIQSAGQNTGRLDGRDYYFNGYHMIFSKSAYTRDMGFPGVMVWCGKGDRKRARGYSLFDAMARALNPGRDE